MRPAFGVLLAIAATTVLDASGLAVVSALPLFPLMGLFWYLERLSRTDLGFVWGRRPDYLLALLHPGLVLGLVALIALIANVINLEGADWRKAGFNWVVVTLSTVLVATVTEEGFFRGWLWSSLKRSGQNKLRVLLWSSLAFAAWHLPAVLLKTGFNPPLTQVPIYLANVAVLGAIWGMLRLISGSVIVPSVSHGLWNGGAYVFFGFGDKVGTLGIQETTMYGPEVGVIGLALNLGFAIVLWHCCKCKRPLQPFNYA